MATFVIIAVISSIIADVIGIKGGFLDTPAMLIGYTAYEVLMFVLCVIVFF